MYEHPTYDLVIYTLHNTQSIVLLHTGIEYLKLFRFTRIIIYKAFFTSKFYRKNIMIIQIVFRCTRITILSRDVVRSRYCRGVRAKRASGFCFRIFLFPLHTNSINRNARLLLVLWTVCSFTHKNKLKLAPFKKQKKKIELKNNRPRWLKKQLGKICSVWWNISSSQCSRIRSQLSKYQWKVRVHYFFLFFFFYLLHRDVWNLEMYVLQWSGLATPNKPITNTVRFYILSKTTKRVYFTFLALFFYNVRDRTTNRFRVNLRIMMVVVFVLGNVLV